MNDSEGRITYSAFKVGSLHACFILDHNVVTRLSCSLQSLVRLKIEIECVLAVARDVTINDKARGRIV